VERTETATWLFVAAQQALYPRFFALCRQMDKVFAEPDVKWAQNAELRRVEGLERLKVLAGLPLPVFFEMLMTVVGLLLLIACPVRTIHNIRQQ